MGEEQHAAQPARRGGRPPLTESRKDEIRLEIAIAAVRLFTEQGLDGTSVAQIADAAGIATRTLWRYFPSKEACAGPLLSFGLDRFTSYVRDWPTDLPLAGAADDTRWFSDASPTRLLLVIDLFRLTQAEPTLDQVWIRCYSDAVAPLAVVLGERLGLPADDLRIKVKASMLLASMHQGLRHYVCRAPGEHGLSLEDTIRAAARIGLAAAEAPEL
ncbi:TetR family transcriptional regulator [Catenulispora sp. NF23]|uniref:TetR family transcriptional regulator n=1 Tax=Catenulispora pinistramenti TaxID=2705254 RepID=A0ABS5KW79_9ACTN|nr:helix-turn-helix domain-containing protein [Catenulispora pinistramenti]MBS2536230.1 TetR family transcriptional regulator [Catenulispora pinistramenti]MBS2550284.1 TetR family transcriptional regulator [Catenulispora pinistramenti]